jgi:hypothetical protein
MAHDAYYMKESKMTSDSGKSFLPQPTEMSTCAVLAKILPWTLQCKE